MALLSACPISDDRGSNGIRVENPTDGSARLYYWWAGQREREVGVIPPKGSLIFNDHLGDCLRRDELIQARDLQGNVIDFLPYDVCTGETWVIEAES
ncbi:MAG: hypothetical protein ACRDI3_05775 [Actinomycetota bacterium]